MEYYNNRNISFARQKAKKKCVIGSARWQTVSAARSIVSSTQGYYVCCIK